MAIHLAGNTVALVDPFEIWKEMASLSNDCLSVYNKGSSLIQLTTFPKKRFNQVIEFFDYFKDFRTKHFALNPRAKISSLETSITKTAYRSLDRQFERLNLNYKICVERIAVPLFDKVIKLRMSKVQSAFENALIKLDSFRNKRTSENKEKAEKYLVKFKTQVSRLIDLSDRGSINFSNEQFKTIEKVKFQILCIESQINPIESPIVSVLNQICIAAQKGIPSDFGDKMDMQEELNTLISQLNPSLQKMLDQEIKRLSTDSNCLKGFGRSYRFENLGRLANALYRVIQANIPSLLEEKDIECPLRSSKYYRTLHALAYGPKDVDPVVWAKEQEPFLLDLIPILIKLMQNEPIRV